MSISSLPIHNPAPAPDGPIACTLHPGEVAGRLEDLRRGVFGYLRGMERPEPTRLRLILAGEAGLETVRELLVREQQCCAFLAFTVMPCVVPSGRRLVVELEVPAEAVPALDGMAQLAQSATPGAR